MAICAVFRLLATTQRLKIKKTFLTYTSGKSAFKEFNLL